MVVGEKIESEGRPSYKYLPWDVAFVPVDETRAGRTLIHPGAHPIRKHWS